MARWEYRESPSSSTPKAEPTAPTFKSVVELHARAMSLNVAVEFDSNRIESIYSLMKTTSSAYR